MFVCPVCARVYPRPGACAEDGTPLEETGASPGPGASSPGALVGQLVGSYRIERLIGRGGMGEVYLGVHPEIGSRVAIKVLLAAQPSAALVERFFAEARAVNLVRHEGIVNVIDLARLPSGAPYIVMEYLEGLPLSAHIATLGPLPLGTLSRVMIETLDALTAAHEAGVIHRDLKPENIFVTALGRAKVLDFGIAKLKPELASQTPETRTGALLGTPHYMSPEQARGQRVDIRSDLYSLGVMLFEGATGRRPFDGGALYDLLHQHITAQPPSPKALRPDLPPAFESVILRALHKDPDLRFQSAQELARALDEASQFLPSESFAPLSGADPARGPSLRPAVPLQPTTGGTSAATPAPAPTLGATVGPSDESPRRRISPLLVVAAGVALVGALGLAGLASVLWLWQSEPAPAVASSSYDPARFDAVAFFPAALQQARQHYPDAELVTLVAQNVGSDGLAMLEEGKVVAYTFRSSSVSPKLRDPSAPVLDNCYVTVTVSTAALLTTRSVGNCTAPLSRAPKCGVKEVVTRARLPSGARATLQFAVIGTKPTWQLSSGNLPSEIDDDC